MRRLILVCFVLAITGLLLRPIGGVSSPGWPVRLPTIIEQRNGTTLLAVGLDRRGAEIARTDAMVVVHFGPIGEPTGLLSIPRDLWVTIPNRGEDRINTAYAWGDLKSGDGVSLARRTVEENFGIRVDRMAVVDFTCFQAAVDAVGGIRVDVADRLVDEQYPVEPKGDRMPIFEPGPQILSGERALQYVRIRSPDSDFARMRRQQQVISAFTGEVHDAGKALRVVAALTHQCTGFVTDLSPVDLITLGTIVASGRDLKMRMINESMVSPTTLPSGAQVLLPRWERIRPVVAEVIPGRGG